VRTERAVRLDDVLMRRTCLAFSGELSEARVSEIATVMAEELEWSAARREDEIDRAWAILRERHGVVNSADVLTN
jgi:glycerol-3-phosphate dehydrogenase